MGLCAGGGGGAVCAWRKKGRRFAGMRERKSGETGEGSAQGVARWRERGPRSRGRGGAGAATRSACKGFCSFQMELKEKEGKEREGFVPFRWVFFPFVTQQL
ncbi:hypothetical protein AAC387_Pa07g2278 [Persea americana]